MSEQKNRKNVLLISFDDAVAFWKYKSVFGEVLQTPNLDRICGQSTAFQAAYCQAPICSPSRASFMSGLSPHQTGITATHKRYFEQIPPQAMWPYALRRAGYFCSSGGKVMLHYVPLPEEVHNVIFHDERRTFRRDWRIPEEISTSLGGFCGGRAAVSPDHDGWFYDHQSADSAIEFLQSYDGEAPFYREVGFHGPHGPWITPMRFKEMYDYSKIRVPPSWIDGFDQNAFQDTRDPPNLGHHKFKYWRMSVRNYFSALSHADHQLGRIWEALKASGHAKNTLVIILSDHGHHLGEHTRFRKHTLWEQVANVPLIIHDPNQPVGQVVDDPVALLDVGPTVMDYLGLPPLPERLGRSLLPQMNWARDPDRVVPTFLRDSAATRQGRYRFIRYSDGSTQFYDLATDWWQTRDLGQDHPDFAAASAAHDACCAEYGMKAA